MSDTAAYYNEHDPYCFYWLENLIRKGVLPGGDVDGRSIEDVKPDDLKGYRQCHFFAGIGVWAWAAKQSRLAERTEGTIYTGSCPCQPFSTAGSQLGFADERHLWPAWQWLIQCNRPKLVFGEQVAHGSANDWLALVQSDMEGAGYIFTAASLCACGFGAPHKRQRSFFVGKYSGSDSDTRRGEPAVSRRSRGAEHGRARSKPTRLVWSSEPRPCPLADGATANMDAVRAYANAIVAPVAIEFINAALEVLP